jgi:hypothetical protein
MLLFLHIPLHFATTPSEWSVAPGSSQRTAPSGFSAGLWAVAPGSLGAVPGAPIMALSDTALRVLTKAAQHPLRLATPLKHLPAAACNAVLRSLLKGGYVEECPAPFEYITLGWRQQDGAWTALRVTNERILRAWDDEAEARPGLPAAINAPRARLAALAPSS